MRTLATDQEVTLVWDDPGDDTITGYEIWRGLEASSLQVLAADTGSAGNSYLDDAVEPETTYHYAINAINADGTSQQSDTISATTQAAPQEGETISARQSSMSVAAVSNLGRVTNKIAGISYDGAEHATSFTTGTDGAGYIFRGACLRLSAPSNTVFTATIYNDNSDNPGTVQRVLTNPSIIDQDTGTSEEFTAADPLVLAASTKYWFTPNHSTKRYFIGIKGHSSADHEYTVRLFKPTEDDYEASTSGAAADGSFGSGNIERLYDIDWHRTANLTGSTKYLVNLTGAGHDPLYNPVIDGIYDPNGNLIADTSDTSSGPGNDSALVFTPESPGRYYIAVRGNVQPRFAGGADDPTGRGHTGSYTLTIGTVNDPDNRQDTTTMRLGAVDTPLVLDQEYSQEFALEHREDQEYIKVSLEEDKVYEIYVHREREAFPSISVHWQQDADAPVTACSTTRHRVFATPQDFSPSTAAYKEYLVQLTAGPTGAGTGTVTIKLIDNDAANHRSYSDRCPSR